LRFLNVKIVVKKRRRLWHVGINLAIARSKKGKLPILKKVMRKGVLLRKKQKGEHGQRTVTKTTGGAQKSKKASAPKRSTAKKSSKSTAAVSKKRSTPSRNAAARKAAVTRKKLQTGARSEASARRLRPEAKM
jgi:hypothetical protein